MTISRGIGAYAFEASASMSRVTKGSLDEIRRLAWLRPLHVKYLNYF